MTRVRIVLGSRLAILVIAILLLFVKGAVPQNEAYHRFADDRTLLGVPDAWNTVSNAASTA
jgi:hypothetical protein